MKKMIQATVTHGKGQGQMEGEKRDSHIRADHAQMQMVLSALVTNADEAMEEGGGHKDNRPG